MKLSYRLRRLAAGALVLTAFASALPFSAGADTDFPQTGASLWGPFEEYWKAHGGLAQFGMPRTGVFPSKQGGYDAQWLERAMFTYTPANPDPYKVQLQLLGSILTENRRSEAPFKRAANSGKGQYFEATGHNLDGKFLQYWQGNGGLPLYGYPISEAFTERSKSDGKDYLVQYFERNRFELHPEKAGTPYEVQLGLLGSEMLDRQGGPAAFAGLGNPRAYPPKAVGEVVPPGGVVVSPGAGTPTAGETTPLPPAPALPPTPGSVLFAADFSSPDLSAWEPLAPLGPEGSVPASWKVFGGVLAQTGIAAGEGSDDAAVIATKDRSFSDFTLDAYFYATSGEPLGAVLRFGDAGFYLLRLYPSWVGGGTPKAVLSRVAAGSPSGTQAAASTSWPGYTSARWQRLTITARGQALGVQVDGQRVLEAGGADFARGGIGLYAYADGSARFDNIRVARVEQ